MPHRFRPKLVALDLDGTLLNSKHVVSARTQQALNRTSRNGVTLLLCTGRPPRYTHYIATQLGLDEQVVTYNGASIHNFRLSTVEHLHQLDAATVVSVIQRLRAACPGVMTGLETASGWYLDTTLYSARRAAPGARFVPPDAHGDTLDYTAGGALKVFFRHPQLNVHDMLGALEGLNVYATWSNNSLLEVQHPCVNKQAALKHLANQLGVEQCDVAAFGDQNNDQQMLRWAGCGVAVANACTEAMAAADMLTASNDDDGVAQVLESWL